jgi:small subunit ribosomal protein S8
MVNDPLGDFLTSLRNAGLAGKKSALTPDSRLKTAVAEKLKAAGWVKSLTHRGKKVKKYLEVELLPGAPGRPRLSGERVSKPSRRVYHSYKEIRSVRHGKGLALYSTTAGILSDKEAREQKLGGECLMKIW